MRYIVPFTLSILLWGMACKGPSDEEKLKQLKTEQRKLQKDISDLEKKLGTSDGPEIQDAAVVTRKIVPENFSKYLFIQAKVDAQNNVIATPRAAGVVTRINVKNGQYVRAGQTLATIDNTVLSQQLNEATQQISFLKNIYEKQKSLWDQNIGTEVQLLTAKNNYEQAQKRKNTLLSQRDMYRITSPISGVVDDVDLRVGEIASPGSPRGIRIVNERDLKVVGNIGEGNISLVSTGDRAVIILPDLQDTISTRIAYVSKIIDPISRAFKVETKLPYSSKYKPNMLAEMRIASYTSPHAIVVESGLVRNTPDGEKVLVARKGKARFVKVKSGMVYNGKTEIKDGLNLDDQIVISGGEGLSDGDPIKIINQ